MTLRYNIAGQLYDDVVPCFFICGDMVFDRINKKWYDLVFIANWAYQNDYNWGPNEYGPIPDDYDLIGINTKPYGPVDPSTAVLVATVTMINPRTYTIAFSGGPTEDKCYLDFDCEFTNLKKISANIEFPEGTDDETAAGIIAAIKDGDLYTSRDGNTVYVIGKNKDFTSFTASVVQGAAPDVLSAPYQPSIPQPTTTPSQSSDVAIVLSFDSDRHLFSISGGPMSQPKVLQIHYTVELGRGVNDQRVWNIEIPANTKAIDAMNDAVSNPLSDVKLEITRNGKYRLKPNKFFSIDLTDWSVTLANEPYVATPVN